MSTVLFTRDFMGAIMDISYELKRMNDLKEMELKQKYNVVLSVEELNKIILGCDDVDYHFEEIGNEIVMVKNKEEEL